MNYPGAHHPSFKTSRFRHLISPKTPVSDLELGFSLRRVDSRAL